MMMDRTNGASRVLGESKETLAGYYTNTEKCRPAGDAVSAQKVLVAKYTRKLLPALLPTLAATR